MCHVIINTSFKDCGCTHSNVNSFPPNSFALLLFFLVQSSSKFSLCSSSLFFNFHFPIFDCAAPLLFLHVKLLLALLS
jgi:hypothetical protein